jgi:DNA invertase Pin-like site-specific DNA recombinase
MVLKIRDAADPLPSRGHASRRHDDLLVRQLCTRQGHSTQNKNAKPFSLNGLAKQVKHQGGERGIRSGRFSQLARSPRFGTKFLKRLRVTFLRSLPVVCGCLALFGIGLSTLSAHSHVQVAAELPLSAPPFVVYPRLRRRKKSNDSRRRNIGASYAGFSSDELQDPKSISDQQRPCRERATRDGNQLPTELEFFDEGVSGAKLRRDGFDRMLAAAQAGLFDTLYVFDLSRLARESIINATTLKKLVHKYKVRVVSLTEGIDSNNDNWFTLATILGLQHEQYLKTFGAKVMRGLIGNLLNGHSVGDLAYGFGSVPIPGVETHRRGRNERPPKKYIVNESEAVWVRKVFEWFVRERQSIRWIVCELNASKHREISACGARSGVARQSSTCCGGPSTSGSGSGESAGTIEIRRRATSIRNFATRTSGRAGCATCPSSRSSTWRSLLRPSSSSTRTKRSAPTFAERRGRSRDRPRTVRIPGTCSSGGSAAASAGVLLCLRHARAGLPGSARRSLQPPDDVAPRVGRKTDPRGDWASDPRGSVMAKGGSRGSVAGMANFAVAGTERAASGAGSASRT